MPLAQRRVCCCAQRVQGSMQNAAQGHLTKYSADVVATCYYRIPAWGWRSEHVEPLFMTHFNMSQQREMVRTCAPRTRHGDGRARMSLQHSHEAVEIRELRRQRRSERLPHRALPLHAPAPTRRVGLHLPVVTHQKHL